MTTKQTNKSFGALFRRARERDDYWVASASLEFTEEITRLMAEQHLTRAELARRLGTSTAYVTKLLRGNVNFTVQTMVRVARALGAEFRPLLQPAVPAAINAHVRRQRSPGTSPAAITAPGARMRSPAR
jgi:transcriptional regulator with XRE-family HTH domain